KGWVGLMQAIAAAIPPGSRVSTEETAMPALYQGRHLSYFPLGMSTADYLVFIGKASEGKLLALGGWITYLDPRGDAEVKKCVIDRINKLGYTVIKAYPGLDYIVMKRNAPND